jgi:hypothetical protein
LGWRGLQCSFTQWSLRQLKRISEAKNEQEELPIAGKSLDEIPREQWPCCVEERATFMAPFEMELLKHHALAETSPRHYGHFKPTPLWYPAYSVGIVPFRWMMVENLEYFADELGLDIDASREPDLGYHTNWVHEVRNHVCAP